MENKIHQALSAALLHLLRPLARVLLQHGMAYGTFAELARKAFVEEGFLHLERAGKRTSVSAVSALTGLTRKETKRLHELDIVNDVESSQRFSRAIRVISGWTSDPRFLDASGVPVVLPQEGEGASFALLVREFSGDITPAAMLTVLQDSGTVAVGDQGVRLLQRAYIPTATPLEKINILGTDVAELIDTIGSNLGAPPEGLRFQRKVSNVLLHPDALAAFRELSDRKSQILLEEYHQWLSSHEVDSEQDPAVDPCYVAIGIYYSDYRGDPEDLS